MLSDGHTYPDLPVSLETQAPVSPPATRNPISPLPVANRHLAGHTPLKAPDRSAFAASPLASSMSEVQDEDDETRSNTERNILLAQHDGSLDGDSPLKGPLHMPELPNMPGAENFTLESLSARLQDIVEHPDDNEPMVLRTPSPDEFVPGPGGTIDTA